MVVTRSFITFGLVPMLRRAGFCRASAIDDGTHDMTLLSIAKHLAEICEYYSVVAQNCFCYCVGWARERGPTLAAFNIRLIEGKVNIEKY
jgi:hypothetical protein